jgi:hypothetical protein
MLDIREVWKNIIVKKDVIKFSIKFEEIYHPKFEFKQI